MEGQGGQFDRDTVMREFHAVSERPLALSKVLPFVATADPNNLRTIATWYGAGAALDNNTPVNLFSQALDEEFGNLNPDEKERVLTNGLRFAMLDMARTNTSLSGGGYYNFIRGVGDYFGQGKLVFFQAGVLSEKGLIYTRNITAYLTAVMEYVGGDLKAAKALIANAPYTGNDTTKQTVGIVTNFLYRSNKIQINARHPEISEGTTSTRQGFQARNPKNRALAFWIDAHLGTFDIDGKNGDLRLAEVLKEDDSQLKTEVFAYLREQLVNDPPGFSAKHALIAKVARENETLYEALKAKYPDSQFVTEYEMIGRLLKLRKIESKTQGGKIEPADLAILLEAYPNLIDQVSIEELETAISLSSDHGVIAKLEAALSLRGK